MKELQCQNCGNVEEPKGMNLAFLKESCRNCGSNALVSLNTENQEYQEHSEPLEMLDNNVGNNKIIFILILLGVFVVLGGVGVWIVLKEDKPAVIIPVETKVKIDKNLKEKNFDKELEGGIPDDMLNEVVLEEKPQPDTSSVSEIRDSEPKDSEPPAVDQSKFKVKCEIVTKARVNKPESYKTNYSNTKFIKTSSGYTVSLQYTTIDVYSKVFTGNALCVFDFAGKLTSYSLE